MPGAFLNKGKRYVRALIEPLLLDGVTGDITTSLADGYLEFCVTVAPADQARLVDSCCWAYDALLQQLASLCAAELPSTVTVDRVGIRLESPTMRDPKKWAPDVVRIERRALARPLGQLLAQLGMLTPASQQSTPQASSAQKPAVKFETVRLPDKMDRPAPDGSEIRLLPTMAGGGLAHCTAPPGFQSQAVRHQSVEEIWYFLEGHSEVWRKQGEQEEVVTALPGLSLTIPVGTHFQFRNLGEVPARFLISTMPPWPGAEREEAVVVEGRWT